MKIHNESKTKLAYSYKMEKTYALLQPFQTSLPHKRSHTAYMSHEQICLPTPHALYNGQNQCSE